jgi:hypothetical protein
MHSSSIFLISPANMSGVRGTRLLGKTSKTDMQARLSGEGVELGEVFTYVSGLYFRGKLEYGRMFGSSKGTPGVHVITPAAGLVSPDKKVTLEELRSICGAEVNANNPAYCEPLEGDIHRLRQTSESSRFVLLGSIATPKYLEPLMRAIGDDLFYPLDFIGLGDMSRGSLLLRSVRAEVELEYVSARGNMKRGNPSPKRAISLKK